ncbi:MAG: hypothetical protein RRZ84_02730 [Romboutsia sp.]
MKKAIIGAIVILSLGMFGCSKGESNDINVMAVNKAEKVVKSEYVSRLKKTGESTAGNYEEGNEYNSRYADSEIHEERIYGADRDRYKDYVESISTFRTEDEEINKLHDKLIETSLDVYNMLDEIVSISIEHKEIMDKGDWTDNDEKRMGEIEEKQVVLEDMIENQQEHVENILGELGNILGVN